MAVQPRNKGQFVQAGSINLYPTIGGSVISHDGTLGLDTVHLQADYPELFAAIGIQWNDGGKGDDDLTQFRTPPPTIFPDLTGLECEWRIRF